MKTKHQERRRKAVIDTALMSGLAIFVGHDAVAQTAPAANTTLASAIDEVIVTATRRQTTMEEIPYNISAVSGEALARTGTTDLAQLANQIPGFNLEDRGPRFAGSTMPIMRGLNASDTDRPGMVVEQMPVGTYIGNSPMVGFLPIMDLERVEVLRGPQGTLYGAGSLGGAVRLIPNSPKLNEWSGTVEASGTNTAHSSDTGYSGSIILNAPLGSIAAIRILGKYEHQPGFIDQVGILARNGDPVTGVPTLANPSDVANSPGVYYSKKDANYADVSSGRISLLLQPTDAFRVELAFNGSYVQGVNGLQDNPSYRGGTAPWDSRITFPATGDYAILSTTLAPYFRHTNLSSLDVSYDAGFATVSSTSTYGETSAVTGSDANVLILGLPATYLPYYTGTPINPRYVATMTDTDSEHRFTEEVRLVSKAGTKVDYVVGAFYEHDTRGLTWDIYEPGTTAQTVASGGPMVTTSADGHTFVEHAPQQFKETAFFGELTWHVTPRWQFTGGGRFFHQTLTQNQDFTSYIIGLTGGNASSNSNSDHIFKVNSSYEFSDHQHLYATFSQGFRRGGVNAFPLSGFYQESPAILDYKADKADNYEVGIIGCNILAEPFFLPRAAWIPIPASWAPNIVQGKTYDSMGGDGRAIWNALQTALAGAREPAVGVNEPPVVDRYGAEYLARGRLGQGAFRVLVTDAYERRCAVTGEKTLPVLEAAHIQPYAEDGPHRVNNGLLLRSDLHKLFDLGYLTVTPDLHVEVSQRLKSEWQNGREYYAHHGAPLKIQPAEVASRPGREFLTWHNDNRYRA